MDDIDIDLVKFFYGIIIGEIDQECSSSNKESLKIIQRLQNEITSLSSCSSTTKCAYIYNYAPCAASTLFSHFKEMLTGNTFLLRRIVIRQSFTVCCFCSDLCVDFLGLTKVLELKLRDSSDEYGGNKIFIDFIIISTDSYWKPTMEKISKNLLGGLKDFTLLVFSFTFVTIDTNFSLTDDIKKTLSQSDFVTFVHFFQPISSNEKETRLHLIQDVIQFIPEGAVLFLLDSPSKEDWCGLVKTVETNDDWPMIGIYGPFSYNVHRMRMLCRKECIRLFSKHYGWRCCALESTNSVAAWYKGVCTTHL